MRPNFSNKSVKKYLAKKVGIMEQIVVDRLSIIGERFVADARSTNTYKDRTGNLRHSIGYLVLFDGREMKEVFRSGSEGSQKAKEFTREIAAGHQKGWVLIVVAGMEYAAYVEAKGYDVITGSSLRAEAGLKKILQRFRKK